MANEVVLVRETHLPIPFTCADGTGIEKGTFLTLSDPNTVAATGANADAIFAGFAAREKIANDGQVKIPVYTRGIFRVLAGENITVGDPLTTHSVANEVVVADVNDEQIIGRALETASDTDTFLMELMPFATQLA